MKICLEFRNPSLSHCNVVVFVNGANAGTLKLRQDEVTSFHQIMEAGCFKGIDEFVSRGSPNPPNSPLGVPQMPQMYEVRSTTTGDLVMIAPITTVRHTLPILDVSKLIREGQVEVYTKSFGQVKVRELPFELSFPDGPPRLELVLDDHPFLKRQAE